MSKIKTDYKRIHKTAAIAIANPRPNYKTIVVVGSGRGGTSVVAGVIHLLGIRMMDSEERNSEDSEIVHSYQKNMSNGHIYAVSEVEKVIAERNKKYDVWGWKDPSADLYLESIILKLRNPHFVFVFRNLLDIALSHVATKTGSIEIGLDSALNRYNRYWNILQRFGCPTLLVGYERTLIEPKNFVQEVSNFLKIKPKRDQIRNAIAFIDPKGGYRAPRV